MVMKKQQLDKKEESIRDLDALFKDIGKEVRTANQAVASKVQIYTKKK